MNRRLFPPINRSMAKGVGPTSNRPLDTVYHVFDGGGGHYTTINGQPKIAPEGGVMHAAGEGWYIMRSGEWHRIKREDIPAEVRATMLILSLSL